MILLHLLNKLIHTLSRCINHSNLLIFVFFPRLYLLQLVRLRIATIKRGLLMVLAHDIAPEHFQVELSLDVVHKSVGSTGRWFWVSVSAIFNSTIWSDDLVIGGDRMALSEMGFGHLLVVDFVGLFIVWCFFGVGLDFLAGFDTGEEHEILFLGGRLRG